LPLIYLLFRGKDVSAARSRRFSFAASTFRHYRYNVVSKSSVHHLRVVRTVIFYELQRYSYTFV